MRTYFKLRGLRKTVDALVDIFCWDKGEVASEVHRTRVQLSLDMRDDEGDGSRVVVPGDNLQLANAQCGYDRKLTISAYLEEGWTKLS